jgi:hypothetical protein
MLVALVSMPRHAATGTLRRDWPVSRPLQPQSGGEGALALVCACRRAPLPSLGSWLAPVAWALHVHVRASCKGSP